MFAASKTAAVSSAANYIEDVFSTYLYTGNGSVNTIANGIDLTEGGLVWVKNRGSAQNHVLTDTARGDDNYLSSNTTTAATSGGGIYMGDGFAAIGSSALTNASSNTYASWTFREQPKFFDVVTAARVPGQANGRISHNLGSVPGFVIVKSTDYAGESWRCYHRSLGRNSAMQLNLTDGVFTYTNYWGTSDPTSTDFGINWTLFSGDNYVFYFFAHDAGGFGLTGTDNVISCGSFSTGNGGKILAPVNLGYEAQWLLAKNVDSAENWVMYDIMRGMNNTGYAALNPNTSGAEYTGTSAISPTATGFDTPNASGPFASFANYIYIAIRRGPMKVPTSGTSVFNPYTATLSAGTTVNAGLTPDLLIGKYRAGTDNPRWVDRLRGFANATGGTNPELYSNETSAESTSTAWSYNWNNTGYVIGNALNGLNSVIYAIKRAPSFFDEVCYTGTGVNPTNFNHNLGAVPELMILKKRSNTDRWEVYSAALGNTKRIDLNTDGAATTVSIWGGTPTTTQFSLTDNANVNQSGQTYVAYLFATCAGVSKVGSYTGTGATQTIACGFTGGARFVMIKRTDSTGDWYYWDTARGMVSGNDRYLLMNSNVGETNTNSIYTASGGFEIVSTAAGINASGGTYIYLAIA